MKDELVDIYDENGLFMDLSMSKEEAKEKGLYHKAVQIWIFVGDKIIIQKRSKYKKYSPNIWSCSVVGHIKSGESSINAVLREVNEEIGLKCQKEDFEYMYSMRRNILGKPNMLYNVYILRLDNIFDISKLKLQKQEVEEIKLVDIDYIKSTADGQNEEFATRINECKMLLKYLHDNNELS